MANTYGDQERIGVVDETSFVKKGTHSVGVARQYLGTAGTLENGQVATILSYAAKRAHVFLDRRLYLPEMEWARDPARRREAHVPQDVRFETKPEQARVMLLHAWEQGVPMRWVTGDEVYGDSPRLRETVQASGRFYVLAVSANTRVWTERAVGGETARANGRTPTASAAARSRRACRSYGFRSHCHVALSGMETHGGGPGRKRTHRLSLGTHTRDRESRETIPVRG